MLCEGRRRVPGTSLLNARMLLMGLHTSGLDPSLGRGLTWPDL